MKPHAPTPPISPSTPSLNDDDAITIPLEHIIALDRRLMDLKNHLWKDQNMARSTRVVNEIRYMLDKDQTGIEFLYGLTNLVEAYVPSYNPRSSIT